MNSESQIADSKASIASALAAARKNHAAALELIETWPHRAGLVARAIVSRDFFAAKIAEMEKEVGV
jgi:hypothetical protein